MRNEKLDNYIIDVVSDWLLETATTQVDQPNQDTFWKAFGLGVLAGVVCIGVAAVLVADAALNPIINQGSRDG